MYVEAKSAIGALKGFTMSCFDKDIKKAIKAEKKHLKETYKQKKRVAKANKKEQKEILKRVNKENKGSSEAVKAAVNEISENKPLAETAATSASIHGSKLMTYMKMYVSDPEMKLLDGFSNTEKEILNGMAETIGFGKMFPDNPSAPLDPYDVRSSLFAKDKATVIIDTDELKSMLANQHFVQMLNARKEQLAAESEHPEEDEIVETAVIDLDEIVEPFSHVAPNWWLDESGEWHKDGEGDESTKIASSNPVPQQQFMSPDDLLKEVLEGSLIQTIIGYKLEPDDAFIHESGAICANIRHEDNTIESYRIEYNGSDITVMVPVNEPVRRTAPTGNYVTTRAMVPIKNPVAQAALKQQDYHITPQDITKDMEMLWEIDNGQYSVAAA